MSSDRDIASGKDRQVKKKKFKKKKRELGSEFITSDVYLSGRIDRLFYVMEVHMPLVVEP